MCGIREETRFRELAEGTHINIFILDADPIRAARMQCNKHVVKMIVEAAQLLTTPFPAGVAPYRRTHANHPCAKWIQQSLANYRWTVLHALTLCEEYTKRYGKTHKTEAVIDWFLHNEPNIAKRKLTPFARCIKEPWKAQSIHLPVVEAYRHYYVEDKARFAKWAPRANAPDWWPFKE